MKNKPVCVTVWAWLKANGFTNTAGMTGQDVPALEAAVQCVALWCASDSSGRKYAAQAFRCCVESMQPTFRRLAYHSIAHVGDWSHRDKLWQAADLETLENPGRAIYE